MDGMEMKEIQEEKSLFGVDAAVLLFLCCCVLCVQKDRYKNYEISSNFIGSEISERFK